MFGIIIEGAESLQDTVAALHIQLLPCGALDECASLPRVWEAGFKIRKSLKIGRYGIPRPIYVLEHRLPRFSICREGVLRASDKVQCVCTLFGFLLVHCRLED